LFTLGTRTSNKPLVKLKRLNTDRVKWTDQDELDFQKLKDALMTAPVLTLPDINKEFQLFVDVSEQTAQGVLTQKWAEKRKPIGFLSKILDPVSRGWPTCLQAIVAVALLVEEARKGTYFTSKIIK
uniref:Reverse transcriptase/retrotransposon-derived protein RNase H-like domain-containing protein n=1 Tax=Zosterops lateralis melanops TaxID=1220523 RepID=A0A8D2P9U8_ZOSLA